MRHGEAVDAPPGFSDGDRWLTAKGRRQTRAVSSHLAKHCRPAAIWTSPLVRATQTAEILASALEIEEELSVLRELASGNVRAILEHAAKYDGPRPLCLVGHEPTLSSLAIEILGSERWPGMKKSAVCALRWKGDERGRFGWMLLPKRLEQVDSIDKLFGL